MKKCVKCNKDIPSDAKICPYCGAPQEGYRPMKRTNPDKKKLMYYYILAAVLIFAPSIISFFFTYGALTASEHSSSQSITLSSYVEDDNEQVQYQYDSLKDFSKKVKNSDKYVDRINKIESSIEKTLDTQSIDKEYSFKVTQNNNLYVDVSYDALTKTKDRYQIEYSYDLSGKSDCQVSVIYSDLKTMDDVKQASNQVLQINQIATLLSGKDQMDLINKTNQGFNDMYDQLKDQVISHYGKGYDENEKEKSCSMRLFKTQDTYRLKISLDTTLSNENIY